MDAKKSNFYYMVIFYITLQSVGAYQNALEGKRAPCQNEGEPVAVDDIDKLRCFSCICKNGLVECSNDCPRIDDCFMVVDGGCCKRCKGCIYKNSTYPSHTEWADPNNPCTVLRCEAGIVTESQLECYTPCLNPLPPEPGKCCSTCPECKINGQIASENEDVIPDDPCLKCRCRDGRMICSKKACPVLQCSNPDLPPGECCPRCSGSRSLFTTPRTCILQREHLHEGETFALDPCTSCSCLNETSICTRKTCPVLDCAPDLQKKTTPCCKSCLEPQAVQSQCSYNGITYQDGQSWKLDACKSCKCYKGNPSCAMTKCNITLPCASGTRKVLTPGECCAKCVEVEGVCMVFGDPHYKTFDGKIYNFKGVGKYQLTADCDNNTFSIRVANSPTNKLTSTSTKRVGVKYGNIRINLQQKGRIKFNGTRIKLPYRRDPKVYIEKIHDHIEVTLLNGVKLLWNSRSFLEVSVPATFKNKLCGLCGNFNSNVQDDLKTKVGRIVKDNEIQNFGSSWCVGKRTDCDKKIKPIGSTCTRSKRTEKNHCKFLNSDVFAPCESKLNNIKYLKACKIDMCSCPTGKCYCESLMAYARECERLGVKFHNWQKKTMCDVNSVRRAQTRRPHRPTAHEIYFNLTKSRNFTRPRISAKNPIPLH